MKLAAFAKMDHSQFQKGPMASEGTSTPASVLSYLGHWRRRIRTLVRGSGFGPAGLAAVVVFLTAIQNPAIAIGIKDEKKSEHKFVVENIGAAARPNGS